MGRELEMSAFEYKVVDRLQSRNRATNNDEADFGAFGKELSVNFKYDGYHGVTSSPYLDQTWRS